MIANVEIIFNYSKSLRSLISYVASLVLLVGFKTVQLLEQSRHGFQYHSRIFPFKDPQYKIL